VLLLRKDKQRLETVNDSFAKLTKEVWGPRNPNTYFGYLLEQMAESGFVDYNSYMARGSRGYRITSKGVHYAQPLAVFALESSRSNGFSMYQLLGQSATNGSSGSPLNRIKMLAYLAERDAKIMELCHLTGLGNIIPHLRALSSMGLLEFDTIGKDVRWSSYQWVEGKRPEDAAPFRSLNGLVKEVASYLSKMGEGNRNSISEYLVAQGKWRGEQKHAAFTVSDILQHLKRSGFVTSKTEIDAEHRSHVKITAKGRELYGAFVSPLIHSVRYGTGLSLMSKRMDVVLSDESRFSALAISGVEAHIAVAPQANTKDPETQMDRVYRYLTNSASGVRANTLINDLGRGAFNYLKKMMEAGWVTRTEAKGSVVYMTNSSGPIAIRT
jgi:DNA-binding PadR family transcriptional regulator